MKSQSGTYQILILVAIFVVFYLVLIRPQVKRQRERTRLISGVKKGDNIVTIGGIYGTIEKLKDDVMVLKVSKDVTLRMSKSAVASKVEENI